MCQGRCIPVDHCCSAGPEICDNGRDDNCDGRSDCQDPMCRDASACLVWTPWLDRDDPSNNGDGEHLDAFLMEGWPVCASPRRIECRDVVSKTHFPMTGEVMTCNLRGGNCLNADQPDAACLDYEVRFLCPR